MADGIRGSARIWFDPSIAHHSKPPLTSANVSGGFAWGDYGGKGSVAHRPCTVQAQGRDGCRTTRAHGTWPTQVIRRPGRLALEVVKSCIEGASGVAGADLRHVALNRRACLEELVRARSPIRRGLDAHGRRQSGCPPQLPRWHHVPVDAVLRQALEPMLRDLNHGALDGPRIEDRDWTNHSETTSAMLWGLDNGGFGVAVCAPRHELNSSQTWRTRFSR